MSAITPTQFLENRDSTGRLLVYSIRTGKTYAVEPIGNTRTNFGDINPATKTLEGNYGEKYRGSIDAKDSLITEDNGFTNIILKGPGEGYEDAIRAIDDKYPTLLKN